jgi:predicted ferric reductase
VIATVGVVNSKLAWYVARSSGLIAWAVITAGILCGLAVTTRLIRRTGVPAWFLELHKFLGTLSVVFVAVHVFALWADDFVYFGARELFVPMASSYRPGAVAWGIAAFYLLVAIQLTSWTMRRLNRKVWHAVHLTSFPLFAFATLHGFTAGADNTNVLVQWVALTGGLLVVLLVTFRLRGATSPVAKADGRPAPSRRFDSEGSTRPHATRTTPV